MVTLGLRHLLHWLMQDLPAWGAQKTREDEMDREKGGGRSISVFGGGENSKRKGKKGDGKRKRRLEEGKYIVSTAKELRQTVLKFLSISFCLHFHFWSQTLLE